MGLSFVLGQHLQHVPILRDGTSSLRIAETDAEESSDLQGGSAEQRTEISGISTKD